MNKSVWNHHYLMWVLISAALLTAARAKTAAAEEACSTTVIVQANDTLTALADEYLGSKAAYATIVTATNAAAAIDDSFTKIDDPDRLSIGWKLCIFGAVETQLERPDGGIPIEPTPPLETIQAPSGTLKLTLTIPEFETISASDYPLSIDTMRAGDYPGGPIVIEETLAPGRNYARYITAYQSDGLKIYALLTVPLGDAPVTGWPVIIFNHGYVLPEAYRSTERYEAYVRAFARNGYIVFMPDYRGHGESEGDARGIYSTPNYTVDVLNALASIKQFEAADPKRIGMWGHSMGGYFTLRAMVIADDIKAGVIWGGAVGDYPALSAWWDVRRSLALVPARAWRDKAVAQYGHWDENPAFWATISANTYLDDLSGPLQLHHSTDDMIVPITLSNMLYEQMKDAAQPVQYYTYDGDNHDINTNFSTAIVRSIAFFDRYVK